ncbi:hypothetical protein [Microcoleus sp. S13_C5]|uniref:hypothetical protein n=1 Tax=Microcoleus sp. S13_C5 TaxID=3055411 RepID=UPI002FD372AA
MLVSQFKWATAYGNTAVSGGTPWHSDNLCVTIFVAFFSSFLDRTVFIWSKASLYRMRKIWPVGLSNNHDRTS